MRQENIKITTKIPIKYDVPDRNGNIYTKEVIENAIKNIRKKIPFEIKNETDEFIPIGFVENAKLSDDGNEILVDAIIFGGGTCENVEFEDGVIKSMEIVSVGIDRE